MDPDPIWLLRRGDQGTGRQREDGVRTQGEDGHPQAQERGLGRNGPTNTLTSDFRPPAL